MLRSTVGKRLSQVLGCPFYDADDFHSQRNINLMKSGIPLTDEDRFDWLQDLSILVGNLVEQHQMSVLACSALKPEYRVSLVSRVMRVNVKFIWLDVDIDLAKSRGAQRQHFMPTSLIDSQVLTLNVSSSEVDVHVPASMIRSMDVQSLVEFIVSKLNLKDNIFNR